jgi:hypothetical protein
MKSINKIIIPLLLLVALAGCDTGFLDRPSQSQISANNFYKTADRNETGYFQPLWTCLGAME